MFKSYIVLLLLINLVIYECKWSNSKTSTNKPRETSTKNKTPSNFSVLDNILLRMLKFIKVRTNLLL